MVLAPEHSLAKSLATDETREAVEKYIFDASMKSNVDRLQDKEKTGVFTGSYAVNPLNGAKTPIWLSDYVLADYGTGAIMCVPAHDDRDFEFAKKFNIPIIQVIAKDGKEIEDMMEAYTEASGIMINSGEWNGMESSVLKQEAPAMIEERGLGKKTVNYKLRDWVFSRQRYWGEPIPIIHCPNCGNVPVPEDQLPLELPKVESYQPTGTGESPLAGIDEWVNTTCPCCGAPAKRETNTMPQWAGSSWYFLRYVDSKNKETVLYDSSTVGGEGSSTAGEGLKQADASLDEYFYLGRLAKGESGTVYLKVGVEGETGNNGYQQTLAKLRMTFAVEKVKEGQTIKKNTVIEKKVPQKNNLTTSRKAVKTGDTSNLLMYSVIGLVGGLIFLIAGIILLNNSRKTRQHREGEN